MSEHGEIELTDDQKKEAIATILGGLGKAEIEHIVTYTTPLFWILRRGDGDEFMKGGSAFLIDTGVRTFGVTAAHVVTEYLQDTKSPQFAFCLLGSKLGPAVRIPLGDRIIDANAEIDIATFELTEEEIAKTGLTVLQGFYHPKWPPPVPEVDRGVTYCGFPGNGRRWLSPKEISFGIVSMAGIATSSHERALSVLIERDHLVQVHGDEPMPDNYDFGGISGGPMLAIVDTGIIRSWMPAAVIIQGPNPSGIAGESISGFEMIKGRPVHFIKADGYLDLTRWEQLS